MKLEDMMKYVDPGSLLIVGNRDRAHLLAMRAGSAVLITGGFDAKEEVKRLADEKQLPLISSAYDTFTVASMINRAIYDRLIKKDIVMVEDVLTPRERVHALTEHQTVKDWQYLVEKTRHSRYPVIDDEGKIIGVVTSKDVVGMPVDTPITEVMTRNPITTLPQTSIASVAHRMVWEGIEMIPVVNEERRLLSVISRQDVLKALQLHQKQPQVGETIEDIVRSALQEFRDERGTRYRLVVTPQMTNPLGMLSNGVMTTLLEETSIRSLRRHRKGEMIVENLTIYL
jgi:predicted transcriptional regulator